MVLAHQDIIGAVSDQVGLEDSIEWHPENTEPTSSEQPNLPEFEPLDNACVLIDDLSLLEVQ